MADDATLVCTPAVLSLAIIARFLGMSLFSLPLLSLQGAMGGIMLVMMMQALIKQLRK